MRFMVLRTIKEQTSNHTSMDPGNCFKQNTQCLCVSEYCATDRLTLASFSINSVIAFKTWNKLNVGHSRMQNDMKFVFRSDSLKF